MSPLLQPSSTSTSAMKSIHTATRYIHREVLYHVDHEGRSTVQSYETRPASRRSTTMQQPSWQRPKASENHPALHCSERAGPNGSKSTSRSPIVIVQSREGPQFDSIESNGKAENSQRSAAPPPAPQPRRLPTPELSDLGDDEPFCHCDVKKKCGSKRDCLRKNYGQALV